jgi:asparagine synthase (glutamine-hydrolysing)
MIFGLVNVDGNNQHPDNILNNISVELIWDNCSDLHFSYGDFHGVFRIDKNLAGFYEDVFYVDEKNGLALLIDGFIYNSSELISLLNYQNRKVTASQLLAEAYLKWGVSFAKKLNGDFVICIYLKNERQVLFFRDHLGIRPIAISQIEGNVFFAGDPMGLSRALFSKEKIDQDYLLNIFLHGSHDFDLLPNKNIFKLKPGHYLLISPERAEHEPYWFPEKIQLNNRLNWLQAKRELNQLLNDAVEIRCDRRFTASAHLSGGLDSGIIAVLSRKVYSDQDKFYGFSWSPALNVREAKIDDDERMLVEKICREHYMEAVYSDFKTDDYLVFVSDWRHPSELMFEKRIVEAAVDRGVNLIFSGWGGDEFISISDRGIDNDLFRNLDWKLLLSKYYFRKPKIFLKALRINFSFWRARRIYSKYRAEKSVYPYIRNAMKSNIIPVGKRYHHYSRRDVHLQLLRLNHISKRTGDWYVHGQRNGLEYRYPLLDKRIVEYMLAVPSRCLVSGGKNRIILRELGKGLLPAEVLKRYSKEDPSVSSRFKSTSREAQRQFVDEFELFRQNPDLDFVDFKMLERKIPEIKATGLDDIKNEDLAIFYYLKVAHEFTRAYYDRPELAQ